MATMEELREPLLIGEEPPTDPEQQEQELLAAAANGGGRGNDEVEQQDSVEACHDTGGSGGGGNGSDDASSPHAEFSVRSELWEMISLGFPLAVSFFCRMGMASTDSAFVGHINDGQNTAETYLAAAVLSDMCVGVFITPPLAFNQVLNALVGQAMGSGNPKMAGIWLQQSMFWLTLTMLPCLIGLFYVKPVLLWLDFPADVAHVSQTYAKYNIVWPIPNGLYQCMRFYFQAQGLPRPAMYNNLIFLFVNGFLNWVFVFGGPFRYLTGALQWKGLGFIGAAVSLSISRTMQCVVYFLYMFLYKKHHLNTWPEGGLAFKHHTAARTWEFMKQSLPNIGTLLFQVLAGQATTVLVGRLGELSIAASSALSTVTIPWSGSLSATCTTISGVRVGHHLGRGDSKAAQKSTWLILYFITGINAVFAILFMVPAVRWDLLGVATNDDHVLDKAATLIPAMLVGTYLNLMVGNITSGVFSGMGRPFISTLLSFGLELPMSIGGVAIYILLMHGDLLGVYWWQAISGGIELVIVVTILMASNWEKCAEEARIRQESSRAENDDENGNGGGDDDNNDETEQATAATTDPESSRSLGEAGSSNESLEECGANHSSSK